MPLILSSLPPTRTDTISAAAVTPACPPGAQHTELRKRVRFAEVAVVQNIDNSFSAMSARVGVNLKELSASQCLTEYGDSLRASAIKDQLLMCVNLNRGGKFVSEGSEALLRKAFFKADKLPRKEACGPGDYSYDVLSVFLAVVEKSRPDLLTAD